MLKFSASSSFRLEALSVCFSAEDVLIPIWQVFHTSRLHNSCRRLLFAFSLRPATSIMPGYQREYDIPEEFPAVLKGFAREVLRAQVSRPGCQHDCCKLVHDPLWTSSSGVLCSRRISMSLEHGTFRS